MKKDIILKNMTHNTLTEEEIQNIILENDMRLELLKMNKFLKIQFSHENIEIYIDSKDRSVYLRNIVVKKDFNNMKNTIEQIKKEVQEYLKQLEIGNKEQFIRDTITDFVNNIDFRLRLTFRYQEGLTIELPIINIPRCEISQTEVDNLNLEYIEQQIKNYLDVEKRALYNHNLRLIRGEHSDLFEEMQWVKNLREEGWKI